MDAKNNDDSGSRKTDDLEKKEARDKSSETQSMAGENRSRQQDTTGDRDPANVEWNIRLGYQIPPYESGTTEMAAGTEPGAQLKRKRTATPETSSGSSPVERARSVSPQAPPSPKRRRRPIPADWTPPLAVGASLGENLSRIEEAERLVVQWEAIIENARRTQPRADLTPFEERLDLVRREYEELEETEDNLTPPDELESVQRERINDRLDELRGALESTPSAAGKINIQAAIDGYTSGHIPCWEYWTLIYGGHIVETCPTYESFTIDREDRLDRYFEQYGNGWLWYEPPLAPKDDIQPDRLLAATWAQPSGTKNSLWGGEAGWEITMGFRQVKTFHSRAGKPEVLMTEDSFGSRKPPSTAPQEDPAAQRRRSSGKVLPYVPVGMHATEEDEKWLVRDDNEGTRCFFLMHLDSGASIPCLYDADLRVLGIDTYTYPPQTYLSLSTAAGNAPSQVYELRVDVCKHNGETLVGENPVWPRERHELGGISPVAVLGSMGNPPKGTAGPLSLEEVKLRKEKGEDMSEEALATRRKRRDDIRLSGMLPFRVCYAACTPGQRLWFGEDRRDVLGVDRMPGQRRFELFKRQKPEEVLPKWQVEERPTTITFEHEVGGTRIIDRDLEYHPGASIVTVTDGFETERNRMEPRRLPTQQPRESPQEVKAQRDRSFLSLFGRLAKKRKHSQFE